MLGHRTALLLLAVSLVEAGLLGYGALSARSPGDTPRVAPPGGPSALAGGPGAPPSSGLPSLPAGLTRDANGMLRGIDLRLAPGTVPLEWEMLSPYDYVKERGLSDLPETIRALEGRRVTAMGFLMPFAEFDDIHQFVLVGSCWSCCFGRPPKIAETLNVTLREGHAGLTNSLEPLRVVGTFHAREVRESGYLLSIFSLDEAEAAPLR